MADRDGLADLEGRVGGRKITYHPRAPKGGGVGSLFGAALEPSPTIETAAVRVGERTRSTLACLDAAIRCHALRSRRRCGRRADAVIA